MSDVPEKDGNVINSGKIRARRIAKGLGLAGPDSLKRPDVEQGRPLESPAQARARMDGKSLPDPPGFKRTVVPGGQSAWEFFGCPSDVNNSTPPTRDGMALDPAYKTREEEDAEEEAAELRREAIERGGDRFDWDRVDRTLAMRNLTKKLHRLGKASRRFPND